MSSILAGAAGGPVGLSIGAGVELITALAQLGASPAMQQAAKEWLTKHEGIPQAPLDAAIAAQGHVGDPK